MPRYSPLDPIFKPPIRRGALVVGEGAAATASIPAVVAPSTVSRSIATIAPSAVSAGSTASPSVLTLPTSVPSPTVTVPSGFTIVGSVTDTLLDAVTGIVKDGNYAYLVSPAQDRMTVCDVSNPASPSVVGSYTSSTNIDNPQRIAKSGNYVFVASSNSDSLTSIDVSTPSAPTLGHKLTDATKLDGAVGVAIQGSYAYVAAGGTNGRRLVVVDISNPLAMTIAGDTGANLGNFALAKGVVVSGNYAYVASSFNDKITVVDVSSPSAPTTVATVTDATKLDNVTYLIKDGNYLYANALVVVDVTTPTSPTLLDDISNGGAGICKIGNIAIVANGGDELDAIDVSNVNALVDTGNFISSVTNLNGNREIVTDGSYIYVAVGLSDRLTILTYS